jgi:hypothetical protein
MIKACEVQDVMLVVGSKGSQHARLGPRVRSCSTGSESESTQTANEMFRLILVSKALQTEHVAPPAP